jgi:phosphoribosylamine--glycine ligase
VAVVIAAGGYPEQVETGVPIHGLDDVHSDNVAVFHGGTRAHDGRVVSSGGRILAVSAWGDDLRGALDTAYHAVDHIRIDGSFHRNDIGRRHLGAGNERTTR